MTEESNKTIIQRRRSALEGTLSAFASAIDTAFTTVDAAKETDRLVIGEGEYLAGDSNKVFGQFNHNGEVYFFSAQRAPIKAVDDYKNNGN
jgi:hypothetical protein